MTDTSPRVGERPPREIQRLLAAGRLAIQTGPLTFRIRSKLPDVGLSLHALYAEHPLLIDPEFADFHVEVAPPANLRRLFHPQVDFSIDGERPFQPLPRDQAPAMLEWGMNWCIAAGCHQWFTVHAAALERDGRAVILPAPPGSGKSTLCAALVARGWRLLSDELTLLDHDTLAAHALARPINLKNASIDLIRAFAPGGRWGPTVYDTQKGRVTHLAPPRESVLRMRQTAMPAWIVFPRYVSDSAPAMTLKSKAETFIEIAGNAFNYSTLGEAGFDVVRRLLDRCDCYDFSYGHLDDAIATFERLAEGRLHDGEA